MLLLDRKDIFSVIVYGWGNLIMTMAVILTAAIVYFMLHCVFKQSIIFFVIMAIMLIPMWGLMAVAWLCSIKSYIDELRGVTDYE